MPTPRHLKRFASGDTLLHRAARDHNHEEILSLIREGSNVNARNKAGDPAFLIACYDTWKHGLWSTKKSILTALKNAGADIHILNKNKDNAIHIAAENGDAKLIELLMKWGGDVNAENQNGLFPLDVSVHSFVIGDFDKGNLDIFKAFLKASTKALHSDTMRWNALSVTLNYIYQDDTYTDATRLKRAMLLFDLLIEAGFNPDASHRKTYESDEPNTPLATILNHLNRSTGENGVTINSVEMVRKLLDAGANANPDNENGGYLFLILLNACRGNAHLTEEEKQVFNLLLDYGADIERLNRKGQTVFDVVSEKPYFGSSLGAQITEIMLQRKLKEESVSPNRNGRLRL